MAITLKYQLHCDKTDLKKEIFEPLAVSEYINETVADYNKALTMAKEIYFILHFLLFLQFDFY